MKILIILISINLLGCVTAVKEKEMIRLPNGNLEEEGKRPRKIVFERLYQGV